MRTSDPGYLAVTRPENVHPSNQFRCAARAQMPDARHVQCVKQDDHDDPAGRRDTIHVAPDPVTGRIFYWNTGG